MLDIIRDLVLTCAFMDSYHGLEVDARQGSLYANNPIDNTKYPTYSLDIRYEKVASVSPTNQSAQSGHRLFGLRATTFWLAIAFGLAVITAAVAAGVAGSIAARRGNELQKSATIPCVHAPLTCAKLMYCLVIVSRQAGFPHQTLPSAIVLHLRIVTLQTLQTPTTRQTMTKLVHLSSLPRIVPPLLKSTSLGHSPTRSSPSIVEILPRE